MPSLMLVTWDGGATAEAVSRAWDRSAPLHRVDARSLGYLDPPPTQDARIVVVTAGEDVEAGHRLCREIRRTSVAPMCLVTSSHREADELLALTSGCDDYMTTQSCPEVLRARLAALASRGQPIGDDTATTFGCLQIDPRMRTAVIHGRFVPLTRIEFELLHLLVAHQRRVVPRWELLERGWEGTIPDSHVLDVHMSRLRCKVRRAGGPEVGEPVPGVGYRAGSPLCPPASCDSPPAASAAGVAEGPPHR